eukprot:m.133819 g.133819  ORF g.133819 m.133819 type:complete len:584 (+) comp15960_c0_seq1:89-1840(+)
MDSHFEPLVVQDVVLKQGRKVLAKGVLKFQHTVVLFHDPTAGGDDAHEQWIEYMTIQTVSSRKTGKTWTVDIFCKTFRKIEFGLASEADSQQVQARLEQLMLPESLEMLDAFQPQRAISSTIDGWNLYDVEAEYSRQQVPVAQWQLVDYNANFALCGTYGTKLYLPSPVADKKHGGMEIAFGAAKHRSKQRLPALSYYWKGNGACICRSAQPMAGVQSKRSEDDEQLLEYMRLCNPNLDLDLIIVDTRPKVNAMANKAAGKGFENMEGYPNCRLEFHGIQNIHAMRESLNSLLKSCLASAIDVPKLLKGLADASWLKHIQTVMKTSMVIVDYVTSGHTVLVHCSDGWDRTAQTCSLAGLMLDPYYRTTHGYCVLIEKEWLSFGHKFLDRNGFIKGHAKEVSPIFLQLLECTWSLQRQYPHAFEFNESFLIALHDCLHSCKFGTFLGNSEQARLDAKLKEKTPSAWAYLYSRISEFVNPFYDPSQDPDDGVLRADLNSRHYEVWLAMYCRWDTESLSKQPLLRTYEYYKVKLAHDQQRLKAAKAKLAALKGEAAGDEPAPELEPEMEPLQAWLDNSKQSILRAW